MSNESENNELYRAIGKLEGKFDNFQSNFIQHIQTMTDTVTNLADVLNKLEKGKLSQLEVNFARLETEVKEKAKGTAIKTGAIVSVAVSIASGIATTFLITKLF